MVKKAAVILLALGVSGSAGAHERDMLARFEGGIGVIPVANGAGPVTADGTFPNVKLKHRERSPARRRTVEDRRPQGRHRHERTDQGQGTRLAAGEQQQHWPECRSERLRDADLRSHGTVCRAQHDLQRAARRGR